MKKVFLISLVTLMSACTTVQEANNRPVTASFHVSDTQQAENCIATAVASTLGAAPLVLRDDEGTRITSTYMGQTYNVTLIKPDGTVEYRGGKSKTRRKVSECAQ
ncbi:MAG: hypothetical protein BGP16_00935 [Sphingobium sp. 66-54]|nr:MAG: hypothetical protein BGP16_00935 [Sphingobium sp. 66-54]